MSQSAIRKILETRLAGWAAARVPVLPVLWENVNVAQEPVGDHLRAYLLPATTTNPYVAGDGRSLRGIFQVSAFLTPGSGPKKGEAIASELDALFPCFAQYTDGVITVMVAAPVSTAPAITEPGWFMLPMSIRYRSEISI